MRNLNNVEINAVSGGGVQKWRYCDMEETVDGKATIVGRFSYVDTIEGGKIDEFHNALIKKLYFGGNSISSVESSYSINVEKNLNLTCYSYDY